MEYKGRKFDVVYEPGTKNHEFRTLVGTKEKQTLFTKTWRCLAYLDQGAEGACVGHGYAHDAATYPKPRKVTSKLAFDLYREAQKLDPWEGEDYEGTSVLAGAKAYLARGFATEYRWCLDMEDLLATVCHAGPVVIGVAWYEGMFNTDRAGYIRVEGNLIGRHCVLIRGVHPIFNDPRGVRDISNLNEKRSSFIIHNSWGRGWGIRGVCRITVADMRNLMAQTGEFVILLNRIKKDSK